MIIREVNLATTDSIKVIAGIQHVLKSRGLAVIHDAATDNYRFEGLLGHSSVVYGAGMFAVQADEHATRVRFGLEIHLSVIGTTIAILSLFLLILGVLLLWLLRDQAAAGVVREFERLIEEVIDAASQKPQ